MNITWIGSPNFDSFGRKKIIQIVIHWFGSKESTLASTDSYFQRPNGTSAHYGIEDNKVHQYVKEEHVAYAVGNLSRNRETISIEHSANLTRNASEETYKSSGELVRAICLRYNIPIDRNHIIQHKQIVSTQCPGTIDIDKIISYAKQSSSLPIPPTNMTDLERKKLVQFDRTVIELNKAGYISSAASEQFFDNPMDEDKFTNLIKRIIRDAKTNATPVDTAAIKELGRKEGVKQVQDIVSKIT